MSAEPEQTPAGDMDTRIDTDIQGLIELLADGENEDAVEAFWRAVQDSIQDQLGHRRYSLWFQQTELMRFEDGAFVVGVPNIIIQQHLAQKYTDSVECALEELLGEKASVKFDVAPRLFRQMNARREAEQTQSVEHLKQPARFGGAREEAVVPRAWGFDNLIVTSSNRLPFAAAREVAGQENPRFRFVYVCGDYGLGKTALLRAIYALAAGPERGLEPELLSAEDWCNEYYSAIQRKTTRQFRRKYRSCRMLLVDDVQFVQGKPGGQMELLHTIKQVLSSGGRVVLGGKPHPAELEEIEPSLQALLDRAFPAVIRRPDGAEREEIAVRLADKHGLKATEEVLQHLAAHYGEDFGRLKSAVSCLAMYAAVHGCATVDMEAALDALAALKPAGTRRIGLEEVREAVLDVFDVDEQELTGSSRSRTVLLARQVGMYLCREMTGASLSEIGRAFGRSSHSTVKHAVDKIDEARSDNDQLASLIRRVREGLGRP